jgi:1,4-alpha-glucan branching enzyme
MANRCAAKPVLFKLSQSGAKKVSVAGDFNNWNTNKLSAKKDSRGTWMAKANLKPGRYEYKFYVDGNWTEDPNCPARVPNPLGTQNCVIEVR